MIKNRSLYITVLILLTSCSAQYQGHEYSIQGIDDIHYPDIPVEMETQIDLKFPIAGIVSHHLLAGAFIDKWFYLLQQTRDVECFIILSPDHWNMGTREFSLTDGYWSTPEGIIPGSPLEVRKLCKEWNITPDPRAFNHEHGVFSLIPFIQKYFPEAKVLPICYHGEPPVNQKMAEKLWNGLRPYLQGRKTQKYFLLVSSDFSHHGNAVKTEKTDKQTMKFLSRPAPDTWNFAGCDNRPAMYVLGYLSETMKSPEMFIMSHSNSFVISGQLPDDITSYYFTFLQEDSF